MDDNKLVSRRTLLATGAALTTTLAGCTGGQSSDPTETSEETPTPESTPEETATPESTPEETATPEDPTPSLSEFDYPEGATQDGVDGRQLYSTHESTLTGAGSLTLNRERTSVFDGDEFTTTELNRFSSNNIYREIEESDGVEYIWSPAQEEVSYVQMEAGFNNGYRINNQAPDTNEVTGLSLFRQYLDISEWGEATEVVEAADGFAVTYNASGVSDNFGGELEEYEASITVSESGYVTELSFDSTRSFDESTQQQQVTASVENIGETTVEEPEWIQTAREEGTQFSVNLTNNGSAFELELVNGNEISTDARMVLRSNQGEGRQQLPEALSVGDTLYLGLSETGELLIDTDQVPDGVTELSGRTTVTLRSEFTLFDQVRRL